MHWDGLKIAEVIFHALNNAHFWGEAEIVKQVIMAINATDETPKYALELVDGDTVYSDGEIETDEGLKAIGIELNRVLGSAGADILEVGLRALEDANFHRECELLAEMRDLVLRLSAVGQTPHYKLTVK